MSPKIRRLINVIITVIIAGLFSYLFLRLFIPYLLNNQWVTSMSINEAIASIAVMVTIVITTINIITSNMNKRYSSKKQLELSVVVQNKKVIITSTIENKGMDRITPKSFYLFINEGSKISKNNHIEYEFPNILKHECGEFDCALAKKCKLGRVEKIPDELLGVKFQNSVSICKLLDHIASDSVNFIDPGEIFSEDTIFELHPGIYRVILLGVSVEADCMCAHKIFIIEEDKDENISSNR